MQRPQQLKAMRSFDVNQLGIQIQRSRELNGLCVREKKKKKQRRRQGSSPGINLSALLMYTHKVMVKRIYNLEGMTSWGKSGGALLAATGTLLFCK